MHPTTKEWVDKAESDYKAVCLLVRAAKVTPLLGHICFNAQQSIEKYLKGRLVEGGIVFSRTHDLTVLLALVTQLEPSWAAHVGSLQPMSAWAVSIRYPGMIATRATAAEATRICRAWRARVLASLGL